MKFEDEAQFQAAVMQACKTLGLLAYHPYRSDRSVPGFPDTVIVGARGVLYRELKMPDGKVSAEQARWLEALRRASQDADVWRPADWPEPAMSQLVALGRVDVRGPQLTQRQIRQRLQRRR